MYVRRVLIRTNPERKAVSEITDRAKRYRAQSAEVRPPGPKRCAYCGSKRNVGIDHVDGNEDHGEPENLVWCCKACNSVKDNVLKAAGLGKKTAQYNPKRRGGGSKRREMEEYAAAIKVMRGQFDGDVAAAVRTIKSTPPSVRSAYTSRTWSTRKAIYGPSGRAQGALLF